MTPDHWRQVENLYHAARDHGPAVLEGTDPDLRREVEKLLAQDSTGKILDRGAGALWDELTQTLTPAPAEPVWAGRRVAQYEIVDKLGAGGMGVVYKAIDTRLNRLVALKFLPPAMRHDPELKSRLTDEARAASALDHPNIVVIHDIQEVGEELFVAMAFHEGVTLREKIAEGLSLIESLRIALQVATGLAKAHENGIFHRDIKPSNIVVAKDGIVRIIDFGLAKSIETTVTLDGGARGTPLYMSPEQAAGKAVDWRTDLWSLGVMLYEMLNGERPFRGGNVFQLMRAIGQDSPPPLKNLPADVQAIVARALEKNVTQRYQSAAKMVQDLSAALEPPIRVGWRPFYTIPVLALLIAAVAASGWFYQRSQRRLWVREQAIPTADRLRDQQKPLAAYLLWREARDVLANDAPLAKLGEELSHDAAITSTPPGATVEIQDYATPDGAWHPLGVTPLAKVRIPSGYLRWRVSKQGVRTYEGAPVVLDMQGYFRKFDFPLDTRTRPPAEMVAVPAAEYADYIWSLGFYGPFALPAYDIDRFEITNRQYQQFVDQGGYQKREYWNEQFVREGRELTWVQAMELLRDASGRPGPSTWSAGHYPAGQADFPVGGVSWYEAAAYAQFAGKSLPTIAQWFRAAPNSIAKSVIALSNFSGSLAKAGQYPGIGPWGTYDMGGNVSEWCGNSMGGGARYHLGGAFDTATNEYFEPGGQPPFHRSANAGFRCVRNSAPLPAAALAERQPTRQNFSQAKPATDEVYRAYKALYSYDPTPLNAIVEAVAQDSGDWRKEKIVIDAAYGKDRFVVYLFLPTRVRPPYQTMIFFPTARAIGLPSSDNLVDMKFIDYVIQSGRAVAYPVYKGTYDRPAMEPVPETVAGRETVIQDAKDLGRTLDYLETRSDIDRQRLAYMGVSLGAAVAPILTAVDGRFKTVIMLDGGFFAEKVLPGADQADFAPRLKAPILMISGKFDWIFLGKEALLKLFGAPAADKKAVNFQTAHDVSEQRADLVREVLAWLDRYLGKV